MPFPTLQHTCPPRFSDIPTFLYRARISLHILSILDTQPGQQKTGFNLIFPCCKIRYIPQSVYMYLQVYSTQVTVQQGLEMRGHCRYTVLNWFQKHLRYAYLLKAIHLVNFGHQLSNVVHKNCMFFIFGV